MVGGQKAAIACLNLFPGLLPCESDAQCLPSETWRRLRPDGPVQHLRAPAPPGACRSLLPATLPSTHCFLSFIKTQHLFFPFAPPSHPPFISCIPPPPLPLSPSSLPCPSPSALLFLPHYVASFAIAAVVLIQKRNLRHFRQVAPHLSTCPPSPPRPPGPRALPQRHHIFDFCKGKCVGGSARGRKPRSTTHSDTRAADI